MNSATRTKFLPLDRLAARFGVPRRKLGDNPRYAVWIGFVCLLVSGGFARSSRADGATSEPPLRFESPRHEFGRINGGAVVRHEFRFINPKATAVTIGGVKSSCSCLAIGPRPERVAPGESGVIPIEFTSGNYSGPVSEHLTVSFADPALAPIRLELAADVWWPIEVSPRNATFEFGRDSGFNVVATVRLTNREAAPLELGAPVSSHRAIAPSLRVVAPGREFELTLRTVPPLPAGNLFGEVKLPSSSRQTPLVVIPVSGLLQPDVAVSPSRLTFPSGAGAERRQQTLSVRSFWTNALEVTASLAAQPGASVETRVLRPGREYQVVITLPADLTLEAGEKLEVRLETNHPRYRVLQVPITLNRL